MREFYTNFNAPCGGKWSKLNTNAHFKKLNSIQFQLLFVFILFLAILSLFFSLSIRQIQKSSYRMVLDNVSANTTRVLDSITKSMVESERSVEVLSSFVPSSSFSEDSSVWYFFYKDLQTNIGLLESKNYQDATPHFFSYNYVQKYFLRSNTHSFNVYEEKALSSWLSTPEGIIPCAWQDVILNDSHCYIYVLKKGDFYLGVLLSARSILDKFVRSSSEETEFVLIGRDNAYLITTPKSEITPEMYDSIFQGDERIIVNKNNATIQSFPTKYGFTIKTVTPSIVSAKELLVNKAPLIILLSGIIIFIFYFLTLKKCVKPLLLLQYAFFRVSAGDLSFRMRENMFTNEYNEVAKAFNTMVREIKDLRLNYYEEKLLQQKAENRFLRAISYPHFLLNNLNLINNFAYENNEKGIHDVVLNLSKYLRYFITADFEKHTLRNDVESAKSYLNLNSLAYPGKLRYSFDVDESLLDLFFPPLIISTIVENCIKHGLVSDTVLDITISLKKTNDNGKEVLLFTCSNSGPTFPEDIVSSINNREMSGNITTHIGLASIKSTLNSQYSDHVIFRLDNTDTGVKVTIQLDFDVLKENHENTAIR